MPLRLLHVVSTLNPAFGGPVEGLTQLALLNQARGNTVEVATLDDPADPWITGSPLTCHALGPGRLNYRYGPRFVPWLRRHRAGYDAVLVHGIWQYGSFGTWRALHGTSTPYFVFTHGMLDPWFKRTYPLKHLKKWLYWPWAEYRVLRDAATVLFTCEEERRLARQSFWLYRAKEFVVSYGTRGSVGDAARQREAFLSAYPQVRDRRRLLFLGRVHEKKGLDLALRAFAAVACEGSGGAPAHLVVAGPDDDAYGAKLKQLCATLGIEQQVTWTGMLRGELKWGALHAADAFVLPSHQENFGIAVAEALSCGVPVLISDKVNIWREIDQDGAGLVEPDDVAGARRLLQRWLGMDAAAQQAMRLRASRCFQERFQVDRTLDSLLRAIHTELER